MPHFYAFVYTSNVNLWISDSCHLQVNSEDCMDATTGDNDREAYSQIEIQNDFFCMKILFGWMVEFFGCTDHGFYVKECLLKPFALFKHSKSSILVNFPITKTNI
jgi:hypothetical protein